MNILERADVCAIDNDHQNVLHRAAEEGNNVVVNEVIEHLEKNGTVDSVLPELMKQKDFNGNTPFMLAVQSGHHETLNTFIERANSKPYVDRANKDNEYPLHMACRYKKFDYQPEMTRFREEYCKGGTDSS